MKIFESINNTSKKAGDLGEVYIEKSIAYFKLKVFQQIAFTVSLVAKALIIGGLLFIGLFFLAVASAIAIGEMVANIALGYVIVASVFIIVAIIIYQFKNKISNMVIDSIYPKFFDEE